MLALALLVGAAAPAPRPPLEHEGSPHAARGLDGAYDKQNPFARILRGALPVSIVHQDRHVLVFIPLEMVTPGHVLVIPKRLGARNLLDLRPDEFKDLMVTIQSAARAQRKASGSEQWRQ